MTRSRHQRASRPALGFSLIELMVSLTIGLVIVIASISAYLGAADSGKIADVQSRMNEDAQAALTILSQQIRMAGNNPVHPNRADAFSKNPVYDSTFVGGSITSYGTNTFVTTYTLSNFSIRGCDGNFNNIKTVGGSLDTLDASTCVSGTSTVPDSVAVSYEADLFNTIKSDTSPIKPTDCLGNKLTDIAVTFPSGTETNPTFYVADNRFYIGTSTTILSPSLYCKGNGGSGTTQPLVENVEDMQFMYGTVSTTTPSTTATIAGYLTAAEVAALATTPADDSTRWGKVLSVRICIVVRSENPVVSNSASGQYYKCDGTLDTSKTDLRLRRAYSTTVVLRNRRF